MKKLELEALMADRAAAAEILATISENDPLGQLSFRSRVEELDARIAELRESPSEPTGSVALMFSGEPVHGSWAIDVDFASDIVREFQNLVTLQVASEEVGWLGSRGPLPYKTSTNLAISDVLRGSVGFMLEEATPNFEIVDSKVKTALSQVTSLIESASAPSESEFELAIDSINQRQLGGLQAFFKTLDANHAAVRIVTDDHETSLDARQISLATARIERMELLETDKEDLVIELLGFMPESRRFEMRIVGSPEILKGVVASNVVVPHHLELETRWRARMRITEVREFTKEPRLVYTLLGLLEQISDGGK